jgi:hypothetical protein
MTDPPGTLEKALERHLMRVNPDLPLPLLNLILGEVPVTHPMSINPHSKASEVFPAGLSNATMR